MKREKQRCQGGLERIGAGVQTVDRIDTLRKPLLTLVKASCLEYRSRTTSVLGPGEWALCLHIQQLSSPVFKWTGGMALGRAV